MKTKPFISLFLSTFAALALRQAAAQPLDLHALSSMVYTQTFDSLLAPTNPGAGGILPGEWSCYLGVGPTKIGTIAPFTNNVDAWNFAFTGDFKNFAGFFDYIGGTNFVGTESYQIQTNEPNRCLGIRQIGSFGDPGASFVLKIGDTVGFHNFGMSLDFLNLDATNAPRTTVWTVEYGWADPVYLVPVSFFPIAKYTNAPGTFHMYHTNITLPDGTVNNINGQVWLRISALAPSTGSGNRESFAIDNVGLTWEAGTGGCTPISISSDPVSVTVYSNATATFTVGQIGTAPYYFQWLKDGVALNDGGNIFGSRANSLSIGNATTNDIASYSVIVSNVCVDTVYSATSHVATLAITDAPPVSISFLRTLVDTNKFAATNSSLLWRTTGLITTATNITTGNTASYYLQDGTGGINLFVTGGSSFRPNMGDEVTVVGFLSSFGGSLELEADLTGAIGVNNATLVQILSNNIAAYPAPIVVSWDNLGSTPTNANLNYNVAGSVVALTNVYFYTNSGVNTLSGTNRFYWVTNSNHQLTQVGIEAQVVRDLTNRIMPSFAYRVQGILVPFTSTSASSPILTNGNYEVIVTRWVDVATNQLSISITRSNTDSTITWFATPLTAKYTVQAASDVTGPYVPIATGLSFTNISGTYTDAGASDDHKFYRVTSP
jgi:hypothetical protein